MQPLAQRVQNLRQNDIRAVTKMVHAVDGINLGQGICDMPVPDLIKQGAHRAIDDDRSVYAHYPVIKRLRYSLFEKIPSYNRMPPNNTD